MDGSVRAKPPMTTSRTHAPLPCVCAGLVGPAVHFAVIVESPAAAPHAPGESPPYRHSVCKGSAHGELAEVTVKSDWLAWSPVKVTAKGTAGVVVNDMPAGAVMPTW